MHAREGQRQGRRPAAPRPSADCIRKRPGERRHIERLAPSARAKTAPRAARRSSCPRAEEGWPWPKGVVSMRAHRPRRLGATSDQPPARASARARSPRAGRRGFSSSPAHGRRARGRPRRRPAASSSARPGRRTRGPGGPVHDALRRRHEGEHALGRVRGRCRDRASRSRRRARSARRRRPSARGCAAEKRRATWPSGPA